MFFNGIFLLQDDWIRGCPNPEFPEAKEGILRFSLNTEYIKIEEISGKDWTNDLTLPSSIFGFPVWHLGPDFLSNHESLTKIVIPEGVKVIFESSCFQTQRSSCSSTSAQR